MARKIIKIGENCLLSSPLPQISPHEYPFRASMGFDKNKNHTDFSLPLSHGGNKLIIVKSLMHVKKKEHCSQKISELKN